MGMLTQFDRRKQRVRRQLRKVSRGRPRLSVYRSSKNIYAQIIDDDAGRTVVAASSLDKDLRDALKSGSDRAAAAADELWQRIQAELFTPAANGLIGHLDAALGQEILDVSETQREPMPAVARRRRLHRPSLPSWPLM